MNIVIGGKGFVGTRLIQVIKNWKRLDKALNDDEYCDIRIKKTLEGCIRQNDCIILLAAEHRDDISPISKYYETNVQGTQNVLDEMDKVGCKNLIFTSSVAVYGLNKNNPNEEHPVDPFNHYGKSKWAAEKIIKSWYENNPEEKSVTIIRPTVIFGEKNRGNVYNLLSQISSGKFLMIGKGENEKSMAYVGNVVDFIKDRSELKQPGFNIFNYTDYPDLTMNSLIGIIEESLSKKIPSINIPIPLGYVAGYISDFLIFMTRIKLPISSVRVKKFLATTKFDSKKVHSGDWKAPYTLKKGLIRTLNYEFIESRSKDEEVFYTE
ncbi:MAG: NAD-dependent epimerase/dehydratase family protein [Schleiferiaceae bacterium]